MRRIFFVCTVFICLVAHGGDAPRTVDIEKDIAETARLQSKGLAKARTALHSAYLYNGPAYFDPMPGVKKIAVDVTFSRFTDEFDLDDVDIEDADTEENFGSNPHIEFLSSAGKIVPESSLPKGKLSSLHVLLVYVVPPHTKRVRLSYWGAVITPSIRLQSLTRNVTGSKK